MTSNLVAKRNTDSILLCLILAGFVYTLVACQAPAPSRPQANPTVVEMTSTQPLRSPTGITGQVIGASDVAGTPDRPLPEQLILAIPSQPAEALLRSGVNSLPDSKLRFLKAYLAQQDPSMTIALSDTRGNYTLLLPSGEYLVCLADSETISAQFPATTRGCGRVRVEPNTLQHVNISSGFGEILLVR